MHDPDIESGVGACCMHDPNIESGVRACYMHDREESEALIFSTYFFETHCTYFA